MNTATPPTSASRAEDIVAQLESLATLPEVTARINAVVKDPNSDPKDLEEVIRHDPALVARIMKAVNSAFFGLSSEVKTIGRAIVMLGFDQINRLALAASMGQMFKGNLCTGVPAKQLWAHCIAVAVVARDMGGKIRPELAEEAFMAGMTHDLGLLASLTVMPKPLAAACDLAKSDPRPFVEIEREAMGVDHQQLGAALTAAWKFPGICQLAAGHHHDPMSVDAEERLVVGLVHVADIMCCHEKVGFNRTALRQKVTPALMSGLGVSDSLVEDTQQRLQALAWSATTIFA
jgi:HD-like signal output (HDOD) protein